MAQQHHHVGIVYWIDAKLFYPLKTNNLKKQFHLSTYFVLLFVGRLVEEKGISVLVKSIKQVKGKSILLIAGDGPLRDEVAIEAQKSDKIRFVGKLTGEELVKYYNLADVLIIPSIHDEGFGRVILESLAVGTPVLGSDRGSIPEAMDNTVGKLFKVSAQSIKKEIAYLKNHPDVLKKFSLNARKYALKRFSEKNIEVILDSYDK
jgi:glycosyltransferase involved in cell wall biosynthesis